MSHAAFCVGHIEDLQCGFPNSLAYWHMIVVFGITQCEMCETEVMHDLRSFPCFAVRNSTAHNGKIKNLRSFLEYHSI